MGKEDIQNKVMEMQIMEGRLKQIDQQLEAIDQQINDDNKLIEHLEELKDTSKSDAVFPLGGGVFVKGSVDKTDKVLVNIGSKILAEKTIDESKELIEKRKEKLWSAKEELGKQMRDIVESMSNIEKEIQSK